MLKAPALLSEAQGRLGVTGEVCLFGGGVKVLAFTVRVATKDVDAMFQPAQSIREPAEGLFEEGYV